jgi:hypothetical protein
MEQNRIANLLGVLRDNLKSGFDFVLCRESVAARDMGVYLPANTTAVKTITTEGGERNIPEVER